MLSKAVLPEFCQTKLQAFWRAYLWSDHIQLPSRDKILEWRQVLVQWCNDKSLPLLIRRNHGNRGEEVIHHSDTSQRTIVPSDNAPAHWSLVSALMEYDCSLDSVRELCRSRAIPVIDPRGLTERTLWRNTSVFRHLKLNDYEEQDFRNAWASWSVRHIDNVAIDRKGKPESLAIEDLKSSFIRLLDPGNMVLVPKVWGPAAEVSIFRDLARERMDAHLR